MRTLRMAMAIALVLTLALGGVAQARSAPPLVTGAFTYIFNDTTRTAALVASGSDPATGMFVIAAPAAGQFLTARVTCLTVDGRDAWIAGTITRSSDWVPGVVLRGVWVRVHDGGRGGSGDLVISGLEQTATDAVKACVSKSPDLDGLLQPLKVGDITIR